jgi:hypothetical protein
MSDQSNNKGIVEGFVNTANRYGMPTMVLNAALAKARYESVSDKSRQGTTDNGRLIKLQGTEYPVLANANPLARVAQGDEIGSLYHESVHSYMWNIESPDALKAYQAAALYYQHEPLADGSRLSSQADLDYFLDEVASEYTEARMVSWWTAFSAVELGISTLGKVGQEKVLAQLGSARELYERDSRAIPVQTDLFGYIFRGWFKNIVRSPLPISPDFATWLDQTTLEGKVKRHFDQDLTFRRLIREAGLPPLPPYAPPPSDLPQATDPERLPFWRTIPKVKPNDRVQPGFGTRNDRGNQEQWLRDNERRQQQLQNDMQRRNRELLQQQQDLRNRNHEHQRETLRLQQEQHRREQAEIQRRHNAANSPAHLFSPVHNPFGGTHMGGATHGGTHGGGIAPYGPFHHAPNLPIHHPEHRPFIQNPVNPFGVGTNGFGGTWRVNVQNKAGGWWRGPLNQF